ncbi:hypothetical protein KS4_02880 [Poriferisphaera corsica]|uniref:Uncharacterized protein n=1 Tax=Poriferisphaera corsica TaxID=2528020 RepID=A0A517YPV4_9BACT|nr:hypothetical protein KS4_02880 [Poriferisphaera corsica]
MLYIILPPKKIPSPNLSPRILPTPRSSLPLNLDPPTISPRFSYPSPMPTEYPLTHESSLLNLPPPYQSIPQTLDLGNGHAKARTMQSIEQLKSDDLTTTNHAIQQSIAIRQINTARTVCTDIHRSCQCMIAVKDPLDTFVSCY